jgi:hypothetical protein
MRLANLTIPLGTSVSNEVDTIGITHITIYGPAVLTGVVTLELSPDKGVTWYDSGTTIAVDARENQSFLHADRVRLTSAGVEAADRVFNMHGSTLDVE